MKPSKLILLSLLHSLGVVAYSTLVGWFMFSSSSIFGNAGAVWGPVAGLMLFVVSALIVGLLIFARPVYMYLEGQKKDAVLLLLFTACWLVICTVMIIGTIALTADPVVLNSYGVPVD